MRNEPTESVVLSISKEELHQLMKKSMRETLEDAGLYVADADDRREAREDFRFLRRLRRAMDGVASKVGYSVLAVLTGAALVVIWAGIKVHVFRP